MKGRERESARASVATRDRKGRRRRTDPSGHETETSQPGADTERTLAAELDGDETERLVARRDQRKVGAREDVGRQGGELGLGEDAVRVHLHEPGKLLGCEAAVEVDDGADADELEVRPLLEQARHDVGNQVDALLLGPAPDKDKEVGLGVLLETGPLLAEALVLRPLLLGDLVNDNLVERDRLLVEGGNVGRIRVGERIDRAQRPERRIARPRALAVLVGDAGDADRVLVDADESRAGVKQVERIAELDVLGRREGGASTREEEPRQ
jgi:hypothetical protein